MNKYLKIILYTIVAWLIHFLIISIYLPEFDGTQSFYFRLIHATEVFAVMQIAFLAFFKNNSSSIYFVIFVSLSTLIVIDIVVFSIFESLSTKFDLFHFVAAYSSIFFAILTAKLLVKNKL